MTTPSDQSGTEAYLKKEGGAVYGPVSFTELRSWAAEGRVAPKDTVSTDQETWSTASDWKQLAMDWSVTLPDGSLYGPVHLMAVPDLLREGIVLPHAFATNRGTGEKVAVTEALVGALLDHNVSLKRSVVDLRKQLKETPSAAASDPRPSTSESETQKWVNELKTERDQIQESAEEWRQKWEAATAESASRVEELEQLKDRLKVNESAAKKQIAKLEQQAKRAARKADPVKAPKNGAADEVKRLEERVVALQSEAESWRKKWEKARDAAAQDAKKAPRPALDPAKQSKGASDDGGTPPNGNSGAFKELTVRNDDLRKESARWKKIYEEEQVGMQKRESGLKERAEELRRSEAAARNKLDKTMRQLRHTERSYEMVLRAAESKETNGEPSAASQIAMLVESHNELSRCYDSLYSQFQENTDALHAALGDRERIEQRADQRVRDMEEVLQREQEEAERARSQFAEIQDSHFQLLTSYREMNDRLIRFLQRARHKGGDPQRSTSGIEPRESTRGPKIRLN